MFEPGSMVTSFPGYVLFASVDSNTLFCTCPFLVVIRFSKIYRVLRDDGDSTTVGETQI